MIPFGNNPLFRFLFGWLLPPKPAFLKFTTTPGIRKLTLTKQVFQDIVLPIRKLEEQIDRSTLLFDAYPLLVYPCRIYDYGNGSGQIKAPKMEYLVDGSDYALYNDLGVYGVPGFVKRKEKYNPVEAMRKMEKFTRGKIWRKHVLLENCVHIVQTNIKHGAQFFVKRLLVITEEVLDTKLNNSMKKTVALSLLFLIQEPT